MEFKDTAYLVGPLGAHKTYVFHDYLPQAKAAKTRNFGDNIKILKVTQVEEIPYERKVKK